MNRRERILAAINHQQTDRVPVDFGGHRSSGIMAIAYRKLREHLGLPRKPIRVYDMIQQLAIIDEDVLQRFGVDAIEMGRGFCQDESYWKPWALPDGGDCLIPRWVDVRKRAAIGSYTAQPASRWDSRRPARFISSRFTGLTWMVCRMI